MLVLCHLVDGVSFVPSLVLCGIVAPLEKVVEHGKFLVTYKPDGGRLVFWESTRVKAVFLFDKLERW